jgi:hypothetical protein
MGCRSMWIHIWHRLRPVCFSSLGSIRCNNNMLNPFYLVYWQTSEDHLVMRKNEETTQSSQGWHQSYIEAHRKQKAAEAKIKILEDKVKDLEEEIQGLAEDAAGESI